MDEFLDQIENAMDAGHFYLALFCCLAIPDICGAISSANGRATGRDYKVWFDRYVSPRYDGNLDGDRCYAFRCAALHQGRTDHKGLGYDRILFLDPSECQVVVHNNVLNGALNIDTRCFCTDIIAGVRQWMSESSGNETFKGNYATLLRRYKGGLSPYISGTDVFT
jgi:hypothetical protein